MCRARVGVERIDITSNSAGATFKADAEPAALVLDLNVRPLAATELVRRQPTPPRK